MVLGGSYAKNVNLQERQGCQKRLTKTTPGKGGQWQQPCIKQPSIWIKQVHTNMLSLFFLQFNFLSKRGHMKVEKNRTQIPYLLLVGSTWVATWPPTGAESPLRTEFTGTILKIHI
jgi:hypothetical protein